MDVDWAESQMPSAELRVGERRSGHAGHLTLAHTTPVDVVEEVEEPVGLCSDAACVRARSEQQARTVKVELDVDALSAALARALVAALDGRELTAPTRVPVPVITTTPKRSFWAGAWHADVVLSSIAILVVVIVLLAWTV